MQIQRLLVTLTVVNGLLLAFLLAQTQAVSAAGEPSVLRARSLEIVDDRGRVRASIKLHPAEAGNPESVLLRLINPDGKPAIKIAASDKGGGVLVIGEGQGTYARLVAEGRESKVDLVNRGGTALTLKP